MRAILFKTTPRLWVGILIGSALLALYGGRV